MTEEFDLDRLSEAMRSQSSLKDVIWDTNECIFRLRVQSEINFNTLIHAIDKYNTEIKQGFAIGEILEYDPTFLKDAISYYNNLIKK